MDSVIQKFVGIKGIDMLYHVKHQRRSLNLESRFLFMFSWCLAEWDENGRLLPTGEARQDELLQCALLIIDSRPKESEERGSLFDGSVILINKPLNDEKLGHPNLLERIEIFKSAIVENYDVFLNPTLKLYGPSASDLVLKINLILATLKDLPTWKAEVIGPVNKQILTLQKKLKFFRNFIDFTARWCTKHHKVEDFLKDIRAWVADIACLVYLFWVNEMDQHLASCSYIRLSDLLQKIQSCTPAFAAMFLEVLISMKAPSGAVDLMGAELAVSFVDLLLENLAIPLRHHVEIIGDGLVFWITFLMDPPEKYEKLILARADSSISEAVSLICSLSAEEMNEDTTNEKSIVLFNFLENVDMVKAESKTFFYPYSKFI